MWAHFVEIKHTTGFRALLLQLDLTKTADKRGTFLNVLAEAMHNKYPHMTNLAEDLPTIHAASKGQFPKGVRDSKGPTHLHLCGGCTTSQTNFTIDESYVQSEDASSVATPQEGSHQKQRKRGFLMESELCSPNKIQ